MSGLGVGFWTVGLGFRASYGGFCGFSVFSKKGAACVVSGKQQAVDSITGLGGG